MAESKDPSGRLIHGGQTPKRPTPTNVVPPPKPTDSGDDSPQSKEGK